MPLNESMYKSMSLESGELVVQIRRKCPRCPGMMVAMYPDKWGKLHFLCEVCQHEEERDQPQNIKIVRWQKKPIRS